MYGEITKSNYSSDAAAGLPPCVRGNLATYGIERIQIRSTPVCTGKSQIISDLLQSIKVYPRVYGEINRCIASKSKIKGLPPCVRGNHLPCHARSQLLRSTPVCTGKSFEAVIGQYVPKVYPRVYGEINNTTRTARKKAGLPPCVRGNHKRGACPFEWWGSTPVCTGKSTPPIDKIVEEEVYPRVYGEIL